MDATRSLPVSIDRLPNRYRRVICGLRSAKQLESTLRESKMNTHAHSGVLAATSAIVTVICLVAGPSALAQDENDPVLAPTYDISLPQTLEFDSDAEPMGVLKMGMSFTVPTFHGLEPAVGVSYNSLGANGFVGMRWKLDGAPFIERASPGRGAPKGDATDVFLLDGEELVPCTTLGGTHCPKRQNFQRISYSGNVWSIWQKDGTRETYSPMEVGSGPTGATTFRWRITTRQDTRGNSVTFSYALDGSAYYLSTVTYNGAEVRLYREARADPVTYARGAAIQIENQRLKSVAISVGGVLARAYALRYTTDGALSTSLLSTVDEYGNDAALTADGAISSGTRLTTSIAYHSSANEGKSATIATTLLGAHPGSDAFWGDVNGDSLPDNIYARGSCANEGAYIHVALANGQGGFNPFQVSRPATTGTFESCGGSNIHDWVQHIGDVNGDGNVDVLFTSVSGQVFASLANGDGTFGAFIGTTLSTAGFTYGMFQYGMTHYSLADIDGNGTADLLYVDTVRPIDGTTTKIWTSLSNGDGTFGPFVGGPTAQGASFNSRVGDINGDGAQDFAVFSSRYTTYPTWTATSFVSLSNGDGTYGPFTYAEYSQLAVGNCCNSFQFLADVNGDGKADAIAPYGGIFVGLSKGNGTFHLLSSNVPSTAVHCGAPKCNAVDANGDGYQDLVSFFPTYPTGAVVRVHLGKGDGTFLPRIETTVATSGFYDPTAPKDTWRHYFGDINGDGSTDVVVNEGINGTLRAHVFLALGTKTRLARQVQNPYGGKAVYDYQPSTSAANTKMPFVLPLLTSLVLDDGRGNTYSRSFQYFGGVWSATDRAFLGFRSVKTVLPRGDYTETLYRQTFSSAGKPERVTRYDATGRRYDYSEQTISESGVGVTTSLVTEKADYECHQTTICRGHKVAYSYDSFGNVVEEIDHGDIAVTGDERTTAASYFPNLAAYIVGLPGSESVYTGTTVYGTKLASTLNFYDSANSEVVPPSIGNVTKSFAWLDTANSYAETTRTYDAYGNVKSITDPRNATTNLTYDPVYNTFVTRRCNALNHCENYGWDTVRGLKTSSRDANNALTEFGFDALGRGSWQKNPDNGLITTQYVSIGSPAEQHVLTTLPDGSANGLWTQMFFDGLGREWKSVKEGSPSASERLRAYSGSFLEVWKSGVWQPVGQSPQYDVFDYDGIGRQTKVTHADLSSITTSYGVDARGPYTLKTDEVGKQTKSYRDVRGNIVAVTERQGGAWYTTEYSFNLRDQLIGIFDPYANETILVWDSLGRKVSTVDMDLGMWSWQYDLGNLVLNQTDAKQQTITYSYDALGRLKTKSSSAGVVSWTYDVGSNAKGRLSSISYIYGTQGFAYDSMGRTTTLNQCIDGVCRTMQQSFDLLGRTKTLTYPNGEIVSHNYNAAGNLVKVDGYVDSISWSAASQPTSMRYSNGDTVSFSYEAGRQWQTAGLSQTKQGTTYAHSYNYNRAGHVTLTDHSIRQKGTELLNSNLSFGYDDRHRLISVDGSQSQTFSYDAIGNITHNSAVGDYTYDPAHKHAVVTAGPNTYSYDANGDMLTGAGGNVYTWDSERRLVGRSIGAAAGSTVSFDYGAGEERIVRNIPDELDASLETLYFFGDLVETSRGGTRRIGIDDDAAVTTQYYYAGPILVAKKDIIHLPGGVTFSEDVPLPSLVYWYHADRLGSVRLITDSNGLAVAHYDYQAFGYQNGIGAIPNDRGFTGHTLDDDTGLVYMRGRFYNPTLGRFLSADSAVADVFDPAFINRYTYASNDPLNRIDPDGHTDVLCAPTCAPEIPTIPVFVNEIDVVVFDMQMADPLPLGSIGTVPVAAPNTFHAGLIGGRSVVDPPPSFAYQAGAGLKLIWDNKAALIPVPGAALTTSALKGISARAGFGGLSRAGEFGVRPYRDLKAAVKGTGLQSHHLYEKRFAKVMGQKPGKMASVAVTGAEHQKFTNAWRAAIPYGQGTANATSDQVRAAARQIYANQPEILKALGL